MEADILPVDDPDETKADLIDGTIGEFSPFHDTHGIYGQGVGRTTAKLPRGWRDRLVPLKNSNTLGLTGYCLDPYDLLIAKYMAGRPKDIEFCTAVLRQGLVNTSILLERLAMADCTPEQVSQIKSWITQGLAQRQYRGEQPPK